jgi:hypothetical protein
MLAIIVLNLELLLSLLDTGKGKHSRPIGKKYEQRYVKENLIGRKRQWKLEDG